MARFADLDLLPTLISSLDGQGITTPTDIQAQTLTALLQGRSVVGVAETGSGKTLAYVLPLLHQLKTLELEGSSVRESGRPRGLVLVPGRELGEQVSKVFKGLTHATRLRVRTTLGGAKKRIARKNVSGPLEVLVATPGRLEQLVESGEVRLDDVRIVVFDEADQLLDPGFVPTISRLLGACPKQTQLAMFSATLSEQVQRAMMPLFSDKPLVVRTKGSQQLVPTLRTDNRGVINGDRGTLLRQALSEDTDASTILFVNTREQSDRLSEWLDRVGIPFTAYRGEMDRLERRRNLAAFRDGQVKVLLTTDLGGRGLDIEHVARIINVHLPKDYDNYLHRVGRTARAGRAGLVINLVTQRDQPLLAKIRKRAGR